MIEASFAAWGLLCLLVIVATSAGIAISRLTPWHDWASETGIHLAFGALLAPFLTGLAAVSALTFAPGFSPVQHLIAVFALLITTLLFCAIFGRFTSINHFRLPPPQLGSFLLGLLLLLWLLALLNNSIYLPLTQNDALEYATVAREIAITGSLATYPVLDSSNNASGFFGPWTHPPLYVSLLYLASAIQGHFDSPGLMRAIAPWFLIASVFGIATIGAIRGRLFALIAAIIVISTPLLFLSADSALIDALPLAGVVALLLLVYGIKAEGFYFGAWIGVGLGISLWTHSQAILFIPLVGAMIFLLRGIHNWHLIAKEVLTAVFVLSVIAVWPYAKNVIIYGTPISDNPLIFEIPELDWKGYFQHARGLDIWPSIIQYGLFKGWFSFEAYGFAFWTMTFGLAVFWLREIRGKLLTVTLNGLGNTDPSVRLLWLASGFTIVYLLGVLASISAGIDLMIRNERYMLVLVPAVALLAAYGITQFGKFGNKLVNSPGAILWQKYGVIAVAFILAIYLVAHLSIVGLYYRWRYVEDPPMTAFVEEKLSAHDIRKITFNYTLLRWPNIRTVHDLQQRVSEDSTILSMRPADMYYANRRMMSYLDPRLLDFYKEKSPVHAVHTLEKLGVTHVHLSDYYLPPVYNSVLEELLTKPELTRLDYSYGMHQIYSFGDSGLRANKAIDLTPSESTLWRRTLLWRFGGRKALADISAQSERFENNVSSISNSFLFHRDYSTELRLEQLDSQSATDVPPGLVPITSENEYVIAIAMKGRAFVRIWMSQFDIYGNSIKTGLINWDGSQRIGELSLTERYPEQVFQRRFKPLPDAAYIDLRIEHVGQSQLKVNQVTLTELTSAQAPNASDVNSNGSTELIGFTNSSLR
jgi:4-amino-4-deoxy-L-arabinose transferase-like glycosyltransferase